MGENPHEPPVLAGEDVPPRMPETTEDAYVPHANPEPGSARNLRLFLFGFVPIVAVAVAIGIWIALSH